MEPTDGLLGRAESDPSEIRGVYDSWAPAYDEDLAAWGYEAPAVSALYLRELAPRDATVLDVGCGTGLVGRALRRAGFDDLVGIDFSVDSLAIAERRGAYRALRRVDLSALPTTLPSAEYGALTCIGVLSYLPDVEAVCRELCRVVAPGAPLVLTQRADLFALRDTENAFARLAEDGTWSQIEVTDERAYLPGNPEFAGVGVRYCVFRRSSAG
ncbi:MAG: class I SAM-dependent methyltransferase [Ectothiorhodospiraceae bacterium]|nr:class I SAM-dependent methyltransferase [Chromatiales bacterium]MCP5154650.1 class I SAM-dependent methyltransferase [Ectothiorhodospiraceae bacterium]